MVCWKYLELRPMVIHSSKNLCTPDTLAFLFTIFFAMRAKPTGVKVPTILGTIAEDATRYFLVIFTAHVVQEITLIFGRVSAASSIQLLSTVVQ